MAFYSVTRNPVVGPGNDNLTNPPNPNAASQGLPFGNNQWRYVQLSYSGTGAPDAVFLPDFDWFTFQVDINGATGTWTVEGTDAPPAVILGTTPGVVHWTPLSAATTAQTGSLILPFQGITAVRINVTALSAGGPIVFNVRA